MNDIMKKQITDYLTEDVLVRYGFKLSKASNQWYYGDSNNFLFIDINSSQFEMWLDTTHNGWELVYEMFIHFRMKNYIIVNTKRY